MRDVSTHNSPEKHDSSSRASDSKLQSFRNQAERDKESQFTERYIDAAKSNAPWPRLGIKTVEGYQRIIRNIEYKSQYNFIEKAIETKILKQIENELTALYVEQHIQGMIITDADNIARRKFSYLDSIPRKTIMDLRDKVLNTAKMSDNVKNLFNEIQVLSNKIIIAQGFSGTTGTHSRLVNTYGNQTKAKAADHALKLRKVLSDTSIHHYKIGNTNIGKIYAELDKYYRKANLP